MISCRDTCSLVLGLNQDTISFVPFNMFSLYKVKNIYVHDEMFSIGNGLLTPTLKARRPELKEYFKEKIEELYGSISM